MPQQRDPQIADPGWVTAGVSLTQASAVGVQGDGSGAEGSISASPGRALRLGIVGT
jgi:hypothetical protein